MTAATDKQWPRGVRVTAEALRGFLAYDPEVGDFVWRVNRRGRGARAGEPAGRIDGHGYRRIKLAGVDYAAHRLAWLYVHGEWPQGEIDHINGCRPDNRLCNLRDVTASINQHNRRTAGRHSPHGLLGVSTSHGGKFRAGIQFDGKNKHLGVFETKEQAHEAYVQAKRIHHEGNTL